MKPTKQDLSKAYELIVAATPSTNSILAVSKFLAEQCRNYPQFLDDLCNEYPTLDPHTLFLYTEIGNERLYPLYVLHTGQAKLIEKIVRLPLALQSKIYHEGAEVIIDGKVAQCPFSKLTLSQASLLFNDDSVRTVSEQKKKLAQARLPRRHIKTYVVDTEKQGLRVGNLFISKRELLAVVRQIASLDEILGLIKSMSVKG